MGTNSKLHAPIENAPCSMRERETKAMRLDRNFL